MDMYKSKWLQAVFIITIFSIRTVTQNPSYTWAKGMGGTLNDGGVSIAVDASGNVYTTGYFEGTADFDPGAGTYNLVSIAASTDIFVTKLDPSGNFIWAKQIAGGSFETSTSICIDVLGNIVLTGYFAGTVDFDPGLSTYSATASGPADFFVEKLDASGNFIWAESFGNTGADNALGLTNDASNNIYVTGAFQGSVDFDPSTNVAIKTASGNSDAFILKLNSAGNFIWAKTWGGSAATTVSQCIIVDNGSVYTSGWYNKTVDFDPGAGVSNLTALGSNEDIFISKLDTGGTFVWAKSVGGTLTDRGSAITTDLSGNVYITGEFRSSVDFDPGAGTYLLSSSANSDAFILKLTSAGNFVWAVNFGSIGTYFTVGNSITTDLSGNVYTVGSFESTVDFNPGASTYTLTSGAKDGFISVLSSTGGFVYAGQIGGSGAGASIVSICKRGTNIHLIGFFSGTPDFDAGLGVANITSKGSNDIFAAKYSICSAPSVSASTTNTLLCVGQTATITAGGASTYTWNTSAITASITVSPSVTTTYTVIGTSSVGCQNSTTITQSVSACTSISQPSTLNPQLILFPNPTSGELFIEGVKDISSIQVYNILGEQVLFPPFKWVQENVIQIDLSSQPKGIYFIKANSTVKKIIIE